MAPGLIETQPLAPHTFSTKVDRIDNDNAPRSIFPDGIRTSGQHPPLYDQLKPFSEFPKHIDGPTVWRREDYQDNPERWTHVFTEEEKKELGEAADRFIAAGTPLTGISQVCCTARVYGYSY